MAAFNRHLSLVRPEPTPANQLCDQNDAIAHPHEQRASRLDRTCGLRITEQGGRITVELRFAGGRHERIVADAAGDAASPLICDDDAAQRTVSSAHGDETRRCRLTVTHEGGFRVRLYDSGFVHFVSAANVAPTMRLAS